MKKIDIFDTTLRDGEQSAGINLNTQEKLEIARQLEKFGVTVMEAGFPAASPGDFEAVKKIAQTVKNSTVTGLARSVQRDIDAAWEALKYGENPHIHVFIATSPIHMKYKLQKSPEEVLHNAVEAVKYAKRFFPLVQFSAEDASRSDLTFLTKIVEAVVEAGATTVNLPDTVGYATPEEYGHMFKHIKERAKGADRIKLSTHCHNDLGMAVANSIAAVENGAEQVEGTINGIGERAGNAALEEIAVAFHIRKDIYEIETGIQLNETKRTSQLVSQLTGVGIQPNKAVVGKNAFAHESGIHQDGMLKNPETYEIITPALIGAKAEPLALGKHSGRHAFKDRAEQMGFTLTEKQLNDSFQDFKTLADRKKEITEDDLFVLFTGQKLKSDDVQMYTLQRAEVTYEKNEPFAKVVATLPSGEEKTVTSNGSGSVEALFNALEQLVDGEVHILDYRVTSVGKGRDALGESVIKLSYEGERFTGRNVSQDVLQATAKAYINAVNRRYVARQLRSETVEA